MLVSWWKAGRNRATGLFKPHPPIRRPVSAGFHYLRKAAELQKSRIATVFGQIVRNQGLDPSILDTKNQKVCQRGKTK